MLTNFQTKFKNKLKPFAKSLLGYLAVFVVIYSVMGYIRQPVMPIDTAPMTTLDGQTIVFDDVPTLVYFWGSWCHVCKHTSPIVNQLDKDVPVLTVAVSSGDDVAVSDFLTKNNYQFDTVNDETGELFGAWQGQVTPSYVIVKDGQAVQGFVGIQPKWVLQTRLWLAQWQ